MTKAFTPHVTVATIIQDDERFLLVKEKNYGKIQYNQPAGHLETNETLQQAALRETLEETGWEVELTHYMGVSLYLAPANGVTYVRHNFAATPVKHHPDHPLDTEIISAEWLSHEDILTIEPHLRSPLVKQAIDDYRNGKLYPLAAASVALISG